MDDATRRAPEETGTDSTPIAMGTIGFDWYLAALGVSRDALRSRPLPSFNEAELAA